MLRKLISENTNYIIKNTYTHSNGTIGRNRRILLDPKVHMFDSLNIDLISNAIIIFELNDEIDMEFFISKIISKISLEIGGTQIDRLDSEIINILQKVYNLEPKQIGSKVFFPIPTNCLMKDNGILVSKCKVHQIRIIIDFSDEPSIDCINDMSIRFDLVHYTEEPDYSNICLKYLQMVKNSSTYKEKVKDIEKNIYNDFNKKQLIQIKQTQFTGSELVLSNIYIMNYKLNFNHDIENLYFYFANENNSNIYNKKCFDFVKLYINNDKFIEFDYENVIYESMNNCKNLPNNVYCINLSERLNYPIDNMSIEFEGLMFSKVNHNFCMNVFAESINYLHYENNMACLLFTN
jgi:hypothetical protein